MKKVLAHLTLLICSCAFLLGVAPQKVSATDHNITVTPGTTYSSGSVTIYAKSTDRYYLTLTESGTLTITTEYLGSEASPWLPSLLKDAYGTNILPYEQAYSPSSIPPGKTTTYSYSLQKGTGYYIYLENTSKYDINYRVSYKFSSANETYVEEYEGANNDSISNANTIFIGDTIYGQMARKESDDYYQITIPIKLPDYFSKSEFSPSISTLSSNSLTLFSRRACVCISLVILCACLDAIDVSDITSTNRNPINITYRPFILSVIPISLTK